MNERDPQCGAGSTPIREQNPQLKRSSSYHFDGDACGRRLRCRDTASVLSVAFGRLHSHRPVHTPSFTDDHEVAIVTKPTPRTRLGRGVATGLSIALVVGASLVAATPAQANFAEQRVIASEIAADASTYTGWHQGYAGGVATVTTEGLQLEGKSQIINGLATPLGIDAIQAVAGGLASWTTTAASAPAFFQIPVNFGADATKGFTTLRPAAPVSGLNTASGDQQWSTSRALGQYPANATATLYELINELGTLGNVEVLAFGVLSNEGTTSVVTGITWMNTPYTFHQNPLPAGTVTVTGERKVGSTLTATTAGWPAGTVISYEWGYGTGAMGGEIDGATASTYTITPERLNQYVGVVVKGTLAGFEPSYANSVSEERVTAATVAAVPQKPAAAAPVANSTDLAAFLKSKGVTPQAQTATGLPAGELNPGKSYTANVAWTATDSFVDVYAFSKPVLVGTFPVVNGVAQITLSSKVLSQLEAGAHTLVATGQTSGAVQAVSLSVAFTLAATGPNLAAPIGTAALLLMLGGALVVARRRSVRA